VLELYHHGSSACAAKVHFALEEKQLPWKGHVIDILRGEQFRPEILALNPKAVVPVYSHRYQALTLIASCRRSGIWAHAVCNRIRDVLFRDDADHIGGSRNALTAHDNDH
jgi:hypothetical protein